MDSFVIGLLLAYFVIALIIAIKLGKDSDWSDNAVIFMAIFWPMVMLLIIIVCILFIVYDAIDSIKTKFKR